MLHDFLFSPFSDPARQQLYDRVRATLAADNEAPETLLLGNFAVEAGGEALDAVVVRPHSITVLMLVPGGGQLQVPALSYGAWQLGGQPLRGRGEVDNPYEQFCRQKEALAAWLTPQFGPEQADLQFVSGLVVFGEKATFGFEVEGQLSQQPTGSFQLLADVAQLPRRLTQLAHPKINLSDADLTQWAQALAEEPEELEEGPPLAPAGGAAGRNEASGPEPAPARSFLSRAWGWLGAEDIPEDTPYGGAPAAQAAASSAEKQRLERLQREAQAQVQQQLQAMEAREAERERSMNELRAQLAQAPPVTTEAQTLRDQLAAENREKAALEEVIRTSRTESAARNQDLDTKINQLGQLIEQLNARAAGPPTAATVAATTAVPVATAPGAAAPAAPRAALAVGYRRLRVWRRRLPQVAVVLGIASLLGLGVRGLSRLTAGPPTPYQENGKWGLADASGQPVVPARYSAVGPVQQERAVVEENGVYGVIDEAGKEVVPPAYDALNPYTEGYARVRVGDAYTFLDEQGQEFPDYYFNALDFAEGYAAVLDHRGWHYLSGPAPEDSGKPPVLFQEAYSFRDGLARVRLADGYTYITKSYLSDPSQGTEPFGRYELAGDFDNGKAQVTQNGRRFVIDTDGEPVE